MNIELKDLMKELLLLIFIEELKKLDKMVALFFLVAIDAALISHLLSLLDVRIHSIMQATLDNM